MASSISILTDIVSFSPVYNRIEIVVNETDAATKALDDFKYIFDVYIENVSSPTYKRFQVPPDSIYTYGTVDIAPYCESACSSVLPIYNNVASYLMGANADGTTSIIKVTVKYGYSYSNAGVYTVVADTVVGSAKYLFQGALTELELMGWTPNDYLCNVTNGAAAEFLTDNKINKVSIANIGTHKVLTDTPTDLDYLVVNTYSNADFTGLIQTATKANAVSQASTASRMYTIATAPQTLNDMTGAFITGAQPVITSSVSSYTVQLTNSASAVASEILYFVIEEPCRYTQRRIHFENRFGAFDTFNFNLRSQYEEEIKRTSYKKNKYPLNAAGINRQYQDTAQLVNYVETQQFLTVRSNYLTTAENEWLKQLIQSTEMYLEIVDHTGVANYQAFEMVTNSSWVEKETSIDKLWMMELKLKLSHSNSRQRR